MNDLTVADAHPTVLDYVNDTPDPLPSHRRCAYVFTREVGSADTDHVGRMCGFPAVPGTSRCIFHTEGAKGGSAIAQDLQAAVKAKAVLHGAQLADAQLQSADLRGALLIGADLRGASLRGANLTRANLSRAILTGADVQDGQMRRVDLRHAQMDTAQFDGADMRGANLSHAEMRRASLAGSNLEGAVAVGAILDRACLRQVNLARANLDEAQAQRADLTSADLSGAHLSSADLSAADLSSVTLSDGVRLRDARLCQVRMVGADVAPDTDLDGATWHERRPWWRLNTVFDPPVLRDEVEARTGRRLHQCERLYRQIKLAYNHSGQYESAGEFYVREMECRRKQFPKYSGRYYGYGLLHTLCNYFESPWRPVLLSAICVLLCAWAYLFTGIACGNGALFAGCSAVEWVPSLPSAKACMGHYCSALYFSVSTFTTLGYGDYTAASPYGKLIAGGEAMSGAFFMALFVVCLARKYGRG